MDGCPQCRAAKPHILAECERLNIPVTFKNAEKPDREVNLGEIREVPFAIVTYNGKVIKGGAWQVWDILKTL